MSEDVAPSTWNLILTDCYNSSHQVRILMKNGEKFTGYVQRHPSKFLHNVVEIGERYGNVVFSVNSGEIAAITEIR